MEYAQEVLSQIKIKNGIRTFEDLVEIPKEPQKEVVPKIELKEPQKIEPPKEKTKLSRFWDFIKGRKS
jgi:hypothetical protein